MMRRPIRSLRRPCLPLLLALALAGCGPDGGGAPTVSDVWVRLPAAPGRPGGGYFTVTGGSAAGRLVAVETPIAERVELHETGDEGGRMTMRRLDGVAMKPGERIAFAPGGRHAMLFGLSADAKPGGAARMTFRFEKGVAVSAEAKLVAAGDDAP